MREAALMSARAYLAAGYAGGLVSPFCRARSPRHDPRSSLLALSDKMLCRIVRQTQSRHAAESEAGSGSILCVSIRGRRGSTVQVGRESLTYNECIHHHPFIVFQRAAWREYGAACMAFSISNILQQVPFDILQPERQTGTLHVRRRGQQPCVHGQLGTFILAAALRVFIS